MNSQQQVQLEDAQKRLSIFRKHLDLLARCSGESKNVDANEVLSAVSELQSLVEWAAQQPELGTESAILLVKLQELHQIRESLEKNPTETGEPSTSELNETEENTIPEKAESYSKDLEYVTDVVSANLCDNNGDNILEEDSINLSADKESLCDYSASTEDPNLANAESPASIEDTNVDIIPNDDKTDEVVILDENDNSIPANEQENLTCGEIPPETAEVQQSFAENKTDVSESLSDGIQIQSPTLFRSEVVIIETDEDNKTSEWLNDSKNSNDPLDICMYAIRNLYESLRVKENELLKLSTMQNDQKHIEALQAVIIDFHKDITNLNSQLEKTKKENMLLKEQVLELEEAENDARLEAQKLEQKLLFLQEKDSHSQAELSQLKQMLKKNSETVTEKDRLEKELRSQIKYMETLVQQYEDQIKEMEAKEIASAQQILDSKPEHQVKNDSANKGMALHKGTQTYQPSQTKINCNGETIDNTNNEDRRSSLSQSVQVPEEPTEIICDKGSYDLDSSILSTSVTESKDTKEEAGLVNIECISQKELLHRLHKLIDEDVSLQQQIHHVDEINLALWKKLQNLDNHIGECKRQNINETDPIIAETELKKPSCAALVTETQESSDITINQNIPAGNSNCLDQNEQYIQERLTKLEEINASFEKELKTRDTICKEKEKKYGEWMETEKRLMNDLKRVAEERDCLENQTNNLKREKEELDKQVLHQEDELNTLKENNEVEITKIRAEQESMTDPLNLKVNQLLTKEKEILKMITNLKSEKSRNQDKSELERLKCGYIELQLELSHLREEIRKIEEQFRIILDQTVCKHLLEETQRISELERLRNENTKCDKMISNLKMKQQDLLNALEKQKKYLQQARENYKKNLEEKEEEHRFVETELKTQLHQIEEGTEIATTALQEERKRVEKELQENIDDLRAKEEVYKARIAELEHDVIHLHEELHKMSAESEPKTDVMQLKEKATEDKSHKINETENAETVTKDAKIVTETLIQSQEPEENLKSFQQNTEEEIETIVEEHLGHVTAEDDEVGEEVEENVDELRAQVWELQCQLEKISGDAFDMPPVQPAKPVQSATIQQAKPVQSATVQPTTVQAEKPILPEKPLQSAIPVQPAKPVFPERPVQTAIPVQPTKPIQPEKTVQSAKPCLGSQKLEDLDYAEVDECCLDAWRNSAQNTSKDMSSNFQGVYGNKYVTGYKENLKNERMPAEEAVEENDYDEVLPRPTNFHVVQQVGSDTLLVGWNYVNPSVLDGFEVYLDDQVHERIYIPDRTKALISGLNLRKPIHLSICALSRYGQMSEPAVLELSSPQEVNSKYFEDEDEYKDFEDPMNRKQRPYSMEW